MNLAVARLSRISFAIVVVAMIITPLFSRGGDERRVLATVVVLAFFAVALLSTWQTYRYGAIAAAVAVVVTTYFIELWGSTTGFPFGSYNYTDVLSPQIAGVPVVVSFAWAAITLTVHAIFGAKSRSLWMQMAMMSVAITAWDVFLDPQMVGEGYWQWGASSVAFRGIPLVNYVGWLATAMVNSTLVVVLCRRVPENSQRLQSVLPLLTYATVTVLSTIGFLFFFDDVVVAVVGAVAMGSCTFIGYRLRYPRERALS